MNKPTVAFFDLDKTLLAVNSATLWVSYALRNKHLKKRNALIAFGWLLGYRFGVARLDRPIRLSLLTLAGEHPDILAARLDLFFKTQLKNKIRQGAVRALNFHRSRGDKLVLLTSGSDLLAQHFKYFLGLDAILATRFATGPTGCLTGLPIEPLCFGTGKLHWAHQFACDHDFSLNECYFYTDSMADAPVLEAVGFPVAINPDPRLRRLAKARGWPVKNWGSSISEEQLARLLHRGQTYAGTSGTPNLVRR